MSQKGIFISANPHPAESWITLPIRETQKNGLKPLKISAPIENAFHQTNTLNGLIWLEDAGKNLISRFNSIQEAIDFCNQMGYTYRVE